MRTMKWLAALGFGVVLGSTAMAAVTGDNENLGVLDLDAPVVFSETETNTNAATAFAGDSWIFTLPAGANAAEGEVVPLNLTLSGATFASSIQSVRLFDVVFNPITSVFDYVGVPLFEFLNPVPLGTGSVSFLFDPLTAGQNYGLLISYSVGAKKSGGYVAAISAVPEPSTLLFAGLGLGALGLMARRRKAAEPTPAMA